jgi:hypothetical protein
MDYDCGIEVGVSTWLAMDDAMMLGGTSWSV